MENRLWLRRFRNATGRMQMRLYDEAVDACFGETFDYPADFDAALQQLNMLRSQHREEVSRRVFRDGFGNYP